MVTKVKNNDKLLAHLMRRASFGSTYSEIKELSELPYDEIVDSLISPEDTSWMGAHIIRRHHFEHASMMSSRGLGEFWLYRMATTKSPFIEKMTHFGIAYLQLDTQKLFMECKKTIKLICSEECV